VDVRGRRKDRGATRGAGQEGKRVEGERERGREEGESTGIEGQIIRG
jgi:hypothetical protein